SCLKKRLLSSKYLFGVQCIPDLPLFEKPHGAAESFPFTDETMQNLTAPTLRRLLGKRMNARVMGISTVFALMYCGPSGSVEAPSEMWQHRQA
ncbi:MAG: hypothetical protein ACKPKO_43435, partial [Candidatus Fonsibacter sp.]